MSESEVGEAHKISDKNIVAKSSETIIQNINSVIDQYDNIITGLINEDYKELKKTGKEIDLLTAKTKYLKNNLNIVIEKLKENSEQTAYHFVEVLDYMREMLHSIEYIYKPVYNHVNNNHKPLLEIQVSEIKSLFKNLKQILTEIANVIESNNYQKIDTIIAKQAEFVKYAGKITKTQIKRVKTGEAGTRNSFLFLTIVNESKNLILQSINLLKSQIDFANYKKQNL